MRGISEIGCFPSNAGVVLHVMETNEVQIFARFLELIRKHSDEECNIEFYAGKLDIEPENLSRIIWEKSDSSFSEWLNTTD